MEKFFQKREANIYHFSYPKKSIWASIVLDIISPTSGQLYINSDFGFWCYYWSHCGEPFKKFLTTCNIEYLIRKLNNGEPYSINWSETEKNLIEAVEKYPTDYPDLFGSTEYQILSEDDNEFTKEDQQWQEEVHDWLIKSRAIMENFLKEEWHDTTAIYYLLENNDEYSDLFNELFCGYDEIPFHKEINIHLQAFMKEIWPDFIDKLKEEIETESI